MTKKHYPLGLLAFITVILLSFSNDLIQYNKEEVFLTENSLKLYKSFLKKHEDKRFVLGYLETDNPIIIEEAFKKIKQKYPQVKLAWAKNFTKKQYNDDIREFYKKNNLLSLKLIDKKGHFFIFTHPKMFPTELNRLFSDILEHLKNVKLIGPSFTNFYLDKQSLEIKTIVFPLLFIFSFIFIVILIRSLIPSFYIFFISLFSVGLTLIVTKVFYTHSNMVTVISPLVSFVITLAVSFHFYFSSLVYKSKKEILKWKLHPFLLMILTTVIGFGSLYLSDILAIKQFALISSFSIFVSSSFTIVFWIMFFDNISPKKNLNLKGTKFLLILPRKTLALLITTISILFGLWSFIKVPVLVEASYFFPQKHIVRTSIDKLHHHFLGNPNLEIIIKADQDNFKKVLEIDKIEQDLKLVHKSINSIASLNTIIKDINYLYLGQQVLPRASVAYYTLKSKIPEILLSYGNTDENDYRITIYGKLLNTEEYFQFVGAVDNYLKKNNIKYEFNGIYYHLMTSQKNLIQTLVKSFLISLLIVCLIIAFSFKSLSDFFIFILVNIGPPSLSLLFMNIAGFSLNVATIMTFSVSFGIIVDSTIHILFSIRKNEEIENYKVATIGPIFYVSLLLIFSFLIIGFNDFLPIKQFGVLMSITILFGLLFDLYIVPALKR